MRKVGLLAISLATAFAQPPDFAATFAELSKLGLADNRGTYYCHVKLDTITYARPAKAWCNPDGLSAVAWSGIRYPIVQRGEPADLDADVRAAIERDHRFYLGDISGNYPGTKPIHTLLVWRAGRADLAAAQFARYHQAQQDRLDPTPWRDFALSEFAADLHMEAVSQHAKGQTARALALIQGIHGLGQRIKRSDEIALLHRDLTRRLAREPRPPLDLAKATLPELIDRLDEVDSQQMSVPGAPDPTSHPIALRIATFGDDAIDALLGAYPGETRLSRSFHILRGRYGAGHLMPVRDVIHQTVQAILWLPAPQDPPRLAAWWQLNRHKSRAHRLLSVLQDEQAGMSDWRTALHLLGRPAGERIVVESGYRHVRQSSPNAPPVGEEIRHEPAFHAALAKCALATFRWSTQPGWAGDDLAKWDAPAATRAFLDLTRARLQEEIVKPEPPGTAVPAFARAAWMHFHALPPGKDRAAAARAYLDFIKSIPTAQARRWVVGLTEPAIRQPPSPDWAELAQWAVALATDPHQSGLLEFTLLALPAYRQWLLDRLADPKPLYHAYIDGGVSSLFPIGHPETPSEPPQAILRICDYAAHELQWPLRRLQPPYRTYTAAELEELREAIGNLPKTHTVAYSVDGPQLHARKEEAVSR